MVSKKLFHFSQSSNIIIAFIHKSDALSSNFAIYLKSCMKNEVTGDFIPLFGLWTKHKCNCYCYLSSLLFDSFPFRFLQSNQSSMRLFYLIVFGIDLWRRVSIYNLCLSGADYNFQYLIGGSWNCSWEWWLPAGKYLATFHVSSDLVGCYSYCILQENDNPYAVPISMGIFKVIDSPLDITTTTIIRRIVANHEAYQVCPSLTYELFLHCIIISKFI